MADSYALCLYAYADFQTNPSRFVKMYNSPIESAPEVKIAGLPGTALKEFP